MRTHRELIAWQLARDLSIGAHKYCISAWRPADGSTMEQLRRAALSIQLNIVEGFAFGPGARCRHHLRIAYGSAVETTEILEFLEVLRAANTEELGSLIKLSRSVQALTLRLWQRSRPK